MTHADCSSGHVIGDNGVDLDSDRFAIQADDFGSRCLGVQNMGIVVGVWRKDNQHPVDTAAKQAKNEFFPFYTVIGIEDREHEAVLGCASSAPLTTAGKKGFVMTDTTIPRSCWLGRLSICAVWLGWKSIFAMAASTRRLISGLTVTRPPSTWKTVPIETPGCWADALIVAKSTLASAHEHYHFYFRTRLDDSLLPFAFLHDLAV